MFEDKIKPKILIVDDDAGNVNFLRLAFQKKYIVLTAADGDEALKILNKPENRDIALILTDEKMPRMTGSELLEKSVETHPHTIRMIITAFPESFFNEFKVDKLILKPLKDKMEHLREFLKEGIYIYNLRREKHCLSDEITKVIESDNRIRNLFSKYLPPEVIARFERRDPQSLRDVERKEVTILYTDIRDFTALSEKLEPEGIVELLNRYFNAMSQLIVQHKGTIDKYIGDAIMAIFGIKDHLKFDPAQDAQNAVRCALEMREALYIFNKNNREVNLPTINFGIGINTGKAVIGNIGSDDFWDYTVIGDVVNTAARIQKLSRDGEGDNRILIGEETYGYARGMIGDHFKDLGVHKVKGKEESIRVYEVFRLKAKM
jgi:class 3 adenylate cyclase